MRNYKELEIYRKAFALTKSIYGLTSTWPHHELYGLGQQIRRSAHSVDSNICEGASRGSNADCLRFIYNAYGSLKESENHLRLAFEVGYISFEKFREYEEQIDHLSRMINSFIQQLRSFVAESRTPQTARPTHV